MDITATEAGKRLGVSKVTASRWAHTGRLEGAWQDSYSGIWHIPEEAVVKALAQRRRTAR